METADRTQALEDCIRRLLSTTEMNLDDMEEDTREAIRHALELLGEPT